MIHCRAEPCWSRETPKLLGQKECCKFHYLHWSFLLTASKISPPLPINSKVPKNVEAGTYTRKKVSLPFYYCSTSQPAHVISPGSRGPGTAKGATEGALNCCLRKTHSSGLSAGIARLETCSPGTHSTVRGHWPSESEWGAQQPLHSCLFLAIWGQKREKWLTSVKLSVANWAVNAWGQWCTCSANPWATSRDFYTLKGWKVSNKQGSSHQKECEEPFFAPWMETQAQGRQLIWEV